MNFADQIIKEQHTRRYHVSKRRFREVARSREVWYSYEKIRANVGPDNESLLT